MTNIHTPVMLTEVLAYLKPVGGKRYIDATLGAAGHTVALAKGGAEVLGIDQDQEMIEIALKELKKAGVTNLVTVRRGHFANLDEYAGEAGWPEVDGILFDLGISSLHLDKPERGFSFRFDAPLDMRMDTNLSVTAKDLVNGLGRKELHDLFIKLGEEHAARRLADAIVRERRVKPIETTGELATIAEKSLGGKSGKIHPATKIFQALRIAVNDELNELRDALPKALSLLKVGGVLAVISFHSLEDRIVKNFAIEASEAGLAEAVTSKPITPGIDEVNINPRSRSAKLRVIKVINRRSS